MRARGGRLDVAEATLRAVLTYWQELPDEDLVDDYFPAQAQFFLGEIFRLHYEAVELDGNEKAEQLAEGPRVQVRAAALGPGPLPAGDSHRQRLLGDRGGPAHRRAVREHVRSHDPRAGAAQS